MSETINKTDNNASESDYRPGSAPIDVNEQSNPVKAQDPTDLEAANPASSQPENERKVADSPSKVENLPDNPSAVSSKSEPPSGSGC